MIAHAIKTDLRSAWRWFTRDPIDSLREHMTLNDVSLQQQIRGLEEEICGLEEEICGLEEEILSLWRHLIETDRQMNRWIEEFGIELQKVKTVSEATNLAFNERLIAFETKPVIPVPAEREDTEDPARGWQTQRSRAEKGAELQRVKEGNDA